MKKIKIMLILTLLIGSMLTTKAQTKVQTIEWLKEKLELYLEHPNDEIYNIKVKIDCKELIVFFDYDDFSYHQIYPIGNVKVVKSDNDSEISLSTKNGKEKLIVRTRATGNITISHIATFCSLSCSDNFMLKINKALDHLYKVCEEDDLFSN